MRLLFLRIITWWWIDDLLMLASGIALTTAGYLLHPIIGTAVLGVCLAYASRRMSLFLASDAADTLRHEAQELAERRKE